MGKVILGLKSVYCKMFSHKKKADKYKEAKPEQKGNSAEAPKGDIVKPVAEDKYKELCKSNYIDIDAANKNRIDINITGKNNKIIAKNLRIMPNAKINIFCYGDNNEIIIDENVLIGKFLNITIGVVASNYAPIENTKIHIGSHTTFGTSSIITYNSNTVINIGKHCMFAFDIAIYCTDSHPIFDLSTKKIINYVKGVDIGNHVWIGAKSTILKNTSIADDCIVGWGSICCKRYSPSHCIIAGNPAKVVKTGVTWDSNSAAGYCQNVIGDEK